MALIIHHRHPFQGPHSTVRHPFDGEADEPALNCREISLLIDLIDRTFGSQPNPTALDALRTRLIARRSHGAPS